MEAVVIGAFLNTCLPKLWEVIAAGHGLRLQIKGDIDYIEEELPSLDACIGKHMLQCISPGSEVREIIKKARRLAEDTEQCISRFLLYKTQDRLGWKMSHATFAAKISGYRVKLDGIKKEFSSLKQHGPTISHEEPQDPHFGKHQFVGMSVPIEELVELLGCVMPAPGRPITKIGTGTLKVISIVGIGGSGKTRLAEQVCQIAGDQFGAHALFRMGLERDVKKVLQGIRKLLQQVRDGASTSTGIQHAEQRYLIVIDDLRSEDDWNTLMDALPGGDVGSRIIVTTSSQTVAEHCSSPSSYVYKMSTLCYEDSLKLLISVTGKISPARKVQLSPLIKTCDGLPLALIESAKLLKHKKMEKIECRKAVRNLCVPEEGSNGTLTRMQWVLRNNYSGLTSNGARACLLYFHMFPFDNLKKRKFLTRRWLAEGLVQRNGVTCSDLDAASDHLKTLSDGSIVRSMHVSNDATVKSCRLPGTIHQFITLQSLSLDFVTFLRSGEEPPQPRKAVRRLSLHDGAADSKTCIDGVDVSLLRTLAVSGTACEAILDFPQYELLRVLDMKEWDYHQFYKGKKLQDKLRAICKLVMLKYLGLPGSIGEVPRDIRYLKELETLDLDVGGTEIVEVYGEVIKLPRLKHLLGKFRLSDKVTPENYIPEDSRLETFSGFVTNGKAAFLKLMKYMKQLKMVKMWCDFKQVEEKDLKDLSAAIKNYISDRSTEPCDLDRSLSIDVTACGVQFLESLEAYPGKLTKIKLHGSLKKWPRFITQLDGITELCLSSTTLCGERPLFPFPLQCDASLLPYLTYLKLVEVELGPLEILPNHFPSLERICFVSEKSLSGIKIEAGALEFLVSLHIICKTQVGLAGIQIGGLESLEEIALDSEVTQTTKGEWKDAARGHPNKPRVLFIEAATKP